MDEVPLNFEVTVSSSGSPPQQTFVIPHSNGNPALGIYLIRVFLSGTYTGTASFNLDALGTTYNFPAGSYTATAMPFNIAKDFLVPNTTFGSGNVTLTVDLPDVGDIIDLGNSATPSDYSSITIMQVNPNDTPPT